MIRRGVAMIVVLASCMVILSAAAIVARVRATSALSDGTNNGFAIAIEVAEGSEAAILSWLRHESRHIVLDPHPAPLGVPLLSENLQIDGRSVTVSVTAWDQCGMLPNTDLSGLAALDRLAGDDRPEWLGSPHPGADLAGGLPSQSQPVAFAARFATHNPSPHGQRQRGGAASAINVNTAPEPLLRAACEDLGIESIESMLAARRSGEQAVLTTAGSTDAARLRLVTSSSAWSVRTDIRIAGPGAVSVSTWAVYILRGGTWIREQRFVIAD